MASRANLRSIIAWALTGMIAAGGPVFAADENKDEAVSPPPFYELGKGLRLGDSGLTLGGYAAAQYQDLQGADARASLSHLSLFLWWENTSRLKFFSELDSEDTLATRYRADAGERRYLALERIYFDYAFNDSLTLRTGKFLTPIGRWNQIHADPLVWTTSRPLITRDLFPDNATGMMALGSVPLWGRQTDYTVYASVGEDPHKDPAQDPFSEAYGARFNLPVSDNGQFGMSYTSFAQTALREEHKQLLGADFLWAQRGYELTGEAAYVVSSKGAQRNAKGGFIQGVAPVHGGLYVVGRLESLRLVDAAHTTRLWVVGLNYRTSNSVSFKLEYVGGINNQIRSQEGILSSVSVLF